MRTFLECVLSFLLGVTTSAAVVMAAVSIAEYHDRKEAREKREEFRKNQERAAGFRKHMEDARSKDTIIMGFGGK